MTYRALSATIASLVTLLIGFSRYYPKVVDTAWMRAEGLTDEELKKGNMALIFGLTSLLSFIAIVLFLKN